MLRCCETYVPLVTVLEVGDGVFEVLSTAGDTHLGGDDFDKVYLFEGRQSICLRVLLEERLANVAFHKIIVKLFCVFSS